MKKINARNRSVLVISDCHYPYHHPDAPRFLYEIKKQYKPDIVISVGDEVDHHAVSFHNHSADLLSPGDELQKVIELFHEKKYGLYTMFNKMAICHSNHGSLYVRKIKVSGLPVKVLRELKDIYETPGWSWHEHLLLNVKNFGEVYVTHGQSKQGLKLANELGFSTIQGHYHSVANVALAANMGHNKRRFSMMVGCLIGDGLAFEYNRLQTARPNLGVGWISTDGMPSLIPMLTDKKNRWTGDLI